MKYSLLILTTDKEAVRFRRIKAEYATNGETFKALLDVYERVGGTDIIKSQSEAEIGPFMTSEMTEKMYKGKRHGIT